MPNSDKQNMERITVTLPKELVDELKDMSEDARISMSEAVREALNTYLFSERWPKIGAFAEQQLRKGKTNAEALEAVRAKFPGSATSLGSISWYRSKLRRTDASVPTDRQAREARS